LKSKKIYSGPAKSYYEYNQIILARIKLKLILPNKFWITYTEAPAPPPMVGVGVSIFAACIVVVTADIVCFNCAFSFCNC
jgi:hypothetical protein